MMIGNITDEQFELVEEVYKNHREAYTLWCSTYGLEHFKEWQRDNKDTGWMNDGFAYFIAKKFMDWRNGDVEG